MPTACPCTSWPPASSSPVRAPLFAPCLYRWAANPASPRRSAASISLALAVTSLGKMLTIIGAVCSTSVQYIMPGGCYYVLFPEGNPTKRFLALALFLLGLVIMPLCVVLTFVSV